ncbi:HS12A-like protein [Mya arenaria]|uniref:HS12A-like protein n=1 Tax=Mya arenaria TaxID=6604 RepID=A0ABY7EYV2_MYAAR|nr:HS12A-like protein [Mya arenaria]
MNFFNRYEDDVYNKPTRIGKRRIYSNRWDGQILPQAPTVLLFNSEKTESYFGFEAEEKYDGLIKRKEHKDWRYFRRFKMDLHREKKLTENDYKRCTREKDACGGSGTVDISAHEVQEDGTLKALIEPSGGKWGGTLVDDGFLEIFEGLFGADIMNGLKHDIEQAESKRELDAEIEMKKRTIVDRVGRLDAVVMAGGFSDSKVVQEAIKDVLKNYPKVDLIIPENSASAIVHGAVLYGFNPSVISTRKSKYSYGISTSAPFVEEHHPLSHIVQRDGSNKCEDIFKVFVKKGEEVIPGQTTATHTFKPSPLTRENQTIEVYKSEDDEPPMLVTECQKVGLVCFIVPNVDFDATTVKVDMKFGGTQMTVSAIVNGPNGSKLVEAFFDWL